MIITSKQVKATYKTRGKDFFKALFDGKKEIDLSPELIAETVYKMNIDYQASANNYFVHLVYKLGAPADYCNAICDLGTSFRSLSYLRESKTEHIGKAERVENRTKANELRQAAYAAYGKGEIVYRSARNLATHQALADYNMDELHNPKFSKPIAYKNKRIAIAIAEFTYDCNVNLLNEFCNETYGIDTPAGKKLEAEYSEMIRQWDANEARFVEELRAETIQKMSKIVFEFIACEFA